jgi:hypothetical protein
MMIVKTFEWRIGSIPWVVIVEGVGPPFLFIDPTTYELPHLTRFMNMADGAKREKLIRICLLITGSGIFVIASVSLGYVVKLCWRCT